ncbi:hypothetical protein LY76DRAFT_103089 [Colletotrichum caudatum]|nr:hypothetical protein LY76DRAFT_103089 [Colletotrichum caudatum]
MRVGRGHGQRQGITRGTGFGSLAACPLARVGGARKLQLDGERHGGQTGGCGNVGCGGAGGPEAGGFRDRSTTRPDGWPGKKGGL